MRNWNETSLRAGQPTAEEPSQSKLDLELAERVYRSMLPGRVTVAGIDVVTRVQPRNRIGGDYATVFPRANGQLFLCTSDVTGHGIAPALYVTRVNSFVREHVPLAEQPCEVVRPLNNFLCDHFEGLGMFLSFFCVNIDPHLNELTYVGCGQPPALHFKVATPGKWTRLDSQHPPLGISPDLSNGCHVDTRRLEPGDRVLVYTDGIIEARNDEGELFGIDRLAQVAGSCVAEDLEGAQLADRVFTVVNEFHGQDFSDDLLLIVVTIQ